VESDSYGTAYWDPRGPNDPPIPLPAVAYLKLAAVHTEDGGVSLFALNRDLGQPIRMKAQIRGFGDLRVIDAQTMHDSDLKAANTRDAPDRIKPAALEGVAADAGAVTAELPPASWTVLRLASA
jgi:alpha-N-arabinofuranosidase